MATAALTERRHLGSRRRLDAMLETLAGYTFLYFLSWALGHGVPGWPDADLHPYFIVVLFIAARYGTMDGTVAGLLGAGLLVASKAQAHPGVFSSFSAVLELQVMTVPYLLLLLGAMIGEVRQVTEDEVTGLWKKVDSMKRDVGTLANESKVVREYNEDLQERIASSTGTTGAFYEAAASVQRLNEEEALPAILEMVQRFVGAEKAAIYVRGTEGWELRHERGWARADEYPRHYSALQPLLARAADGQVVTVLDVPEAQGSEIAMAAPLIAEDAGGQRRVHAAIAVLALPLSNLNAGTVRNLTGISVWGSQVITAAQRFERVKDRDPADEQTGTYRYGYGARRLDDETARWRRYGTPVALVLIRILNFERIPRAKRQAFLRRAARLLLRNLRSIDIVARWKTPDTFALILPATKSDGARILSARLQAQFQEDVFADVPASAELSVKFGVATTGEHGDSRDELSRQAEKLEL
jgi:diguanylate cyclase (GGDEF)-like protein